MFLLWMAHNSRIKKITSKTNLDDIGARNGMLFNQITKCYKQWLKFNPFNNEHRDKTPIQNFHLQTQKLKTNKNRQT